jgi:hypothetical protein
MKQVGWKRVLLAAAVFACGSLGSVEWSRDNAPSAGFISADVVISASTAGAGEASRAVRRASCAVVRYYVARYTAPAAEAWARSKGATEAEIQSARRCIAATNRTDGPLIAITDQVTAGPGPTTAIVAAGDVIGTTISCARCPAT